MSPRSSSSSTKSSTLVSKVAGLAAVVPVVFAFASTLGGCPIYAADSCSADPNCTPSYDASPPPPIDSGTDDGAGCGAGCSAGYVCTSLSDGRFGCAPYDCRASEKACTGGQTCTQNDRGVYTCGTAGPVDCTTTGCITGYACTDASGKKQCTSTDPNACVTDADCPAKTGAGSLCLGGVCKAPKDLCSDSTQCKSGETCADGRCEPKCASTCATGYSCDSKTGLCVAGGGVCDATKPCGSGTTCVNGRCVAPCATDGSCGSGLVCVAGGCVVDDRPNFFCDKAGTADGTQDACASGSLCLHHNCYIACTGPSDTTTCAKADTFNVCKEVTTSSGAHDVCGSSTNLGSECDPTSTPPKTCAVGKVCIDGFCK